MYWYLWHFSYGCMYYSLWTFLQEISQGKRGNTRYYTWDSASTKRNWTLWARYWWKETTGSAIVVQYRGSEIRWCCWMLNGGVRNGIPRKQNRWNWKNLQGNEYMWNQKENNREGERRVVFQLSSANVSSCTTVVLLNKADRGGFLD